MLCRPSCCGTGLASTWTRRDAPAHGQTHTCTLRLLLLSEKDSNLELILGHKSSESLNSGLELHLLFTALLLARVGNEDELFYTAFSGMGV